MNTIAKAVACGLCVAGLVATGANAASLYFAKRPVKTQSESTCFSFARDVAHRHLSQVRFTPGVEVAGGRGNLYASITCIGGGGGRPATAVVMVVGDDPQETSGLRDKMANEVAGIQLID